jgi:dephospho-CoA kinase
VGLTGGLASGKSTVARKLGRLGVPVFDCDTHVHELYGPGADGTEAVMRLFGGGVLSPDGGVDREALARRVLRDPEALRSLETVVHPLVRRDVERWLIQLSESPEGAPIAVVEAALLVETGSYRDYDVLIVVWCSEEQQIERAIARGLDRDRAWEFVAAQLTMEDKRALADVVIENSGTIEQLEREVNSAWKEVEALCRAL